jgi:SP family galactose:H+ symporter-like MFS transporter
MSADSGASSPLDNISGEGLNKVRRWSLWINLATFLIGYATGVIAGALLYIRADLGLDETQQGLVTSVLLLGALVAAVFTGRMADRFGRKKILLVAGVLFVLGFAVSALATGFALLIMGRLVMGLGVGIASALVPTYLGEISPAQIRGRMLTLNQLMQTVGMLVATCWRQSQVPTAPTWSSSATAAKTRNTGGSRHRITDPMVRRGGARS